MAIYHFTSKIIARSKGQSAIGAAAYRHADKLKDERLDKTFDYSKKANVIHSELLIPKGIPWTDALNALAKTDNCLATEQLWNLVESTEKRKDAQLAREIEFALPVELDQVKGIALAREFIQDQCVSRGMMADMAVHWDSGNPHVHVMLTMREITPDGFGQKVREWNHKAFLCELRKQWAEYTNFHLRLHHVDAKIDHRSYADQGIDLIPGRHEGRAVHDMEKRHIATERMAEANAIRKENLAHIIGKPTVLLDKLTREAPQFSAETLIAELGRYVNDRRAFDYSLNENKTVDSVKAPTVEVANVADIASSQGQTAVAHTHRSSSDQSRLPEALRFVADAEVFVDTQSDPKPLVLSVASISDLFNRITQQDSVFSEREMATALSTYTDHAELFVQALIKLKTATDLIPLGPGEDGRERYTTRDMFDLENQLQDFAESLGHQSTHRVRSRLAQRLAKQKRLSPEQLSGVNHLLQGGDCVALVGRAGTGKSYSLNVARAVWEQSGYHVKGIALSGKAAVGLAAEAGIKSRTIASFLASLAHGKETLSPSDVIVMDEAGMTDSRSFHSVLQAVSEAGAKLVLVGDPAQLQPVGPGAPFRALLTWLGYAEFTTVYRQQVPWQQKATQQFSRGEVDEALSAYAEKGFVDLSSQTTDESLEHLIASWSQDRKQLGGSLSDYLILAYRNADVDQLNILARDQRIAGQEIDVGVSVRTQFGTLALSVDDRVLFLKKDRGMGVENGQLGVVVGIETTQQGQVTLLRVQLDGQEAPIVTFNPNDYGHIKHGYAVTVHKAQGMSVLYNYVCAAGRWTRDLAYVAMTRHRKQVRLFGDTGSYPDQDALVRKLGRMPTKDSVFDYPLYFMRRRGLSPEAKASTIKVHLSDRLKTLKEVLFDKVSETLRPGWRFTQHTQEADAAHDVMDTVRRREDAKTVYQYVQAHQAVGKQWAKVQAQLEIIVGSNPTPKDRYAALDLIKALPRYRGFDAAMQARNALAHTLYQAPHRYRRALVDEYGIALTQLANHANTHTRRLRVTDYMHEVNVGRVIFRDQLAAQLKADIKSYYPVLKAQGVDTRLLSQYAKAHERRLLFKTLTPQQQCDFKVVDNYQRLARRSQQVWSRLNLAQSSTAIEKAPGQISIKEPIVLRDRLGEAMTVNAERDRLALIIQASPERYQMALTHYHFSIPGLTQDSDWDAMQAEKAEQRWVALEKRAQRAAAIQRVQDYLSACVKTDQARDAQQFLAHQIVADTKAHHGAIIQTGREIKTTWQAIRKDAKAYARSEMLSTLNQAQQAAFRVVEDFVQARRDTAQSWAEVMPAKIEINRQSPGASLSDTVMAIPKAYTLARNTLASQIQDNPERYQPALDFYQLSFEQLDPAAYAAACRERVTQFQQKRGTLLMRVGLAQRITQDTKGHYGALVELGVDWKRLYRYAHVGVRLDKLSVLSPEEQTQYKAVMRYRGLRIQAAKAWSAIFDAKKNGRNIAAHRYHHAFALNAARDALADRLYARLSDMGDYCHDLQVPLSAIVDHATRYQQRREDLGHYLKTRQQLLTTFHCAKTTLLEAALAQQSDYRDWREQWEDLMEQAQGFHRQVVNYQALLKEKGLSVNLFKDDLALTQPLDRLLTLEQVSTPKKASKTPILYKNTRQRWDVDALIRGLQGEMDTFVEILIGKKPTQKTGQGLRFGKKGSLWVGLSDQVCGTWYDHELGRGGGPLQLVQEYIGCDFKGALEYAGQYLGMSPEDFEQHQATLPKRPQKAELKADKIIIPLKKQRYIDRLYRESQPLTGTLGERYLKTHRGIATLGSDDCRFHSSAWDGVTQSASPALLTFSRNATGELVGLQRIFLDAKTGQKKAYRESSQTPKRSYGPVGQGAVLIQSGQQSQEALTILAEGPETALSVAQAYPQATVYTTLGISNMVKFNLPISTDKILIAADQDGPNTSAEKTLKKAITHLANKGVDVYVAQPAWVSPKPGEKPQKIDFNDVLQAQGVEGVKTLLDQAQCVEKAVTPERIKAAIQQTFADAVLTDTQVMDKQSVTNVPLTPSVTVSNSSHVLNESTSLSTEFVFDPTFANVPDNVVLETIEHSRSIKWLARTRRMHAKASNDKALKASLVDMKKAVMSIAESEILMTKIEAQSPALKQYFYRAHCHLLLEQHPNWHDPALKSQWQALEQVDYPVAQWLLENYKKPIAEMTPYQLRKHYELMGGRVDILAKHHRWMEYLKQAAPLLSERFTEKSHSLARERYHERDR